jgi:phosphoglycolate phosphatase
MGDTDLVGNLHRLIAFDLDGTLIDSRRDLADAANDLIAALGGEPLAEDTIVDMVGEGAGRLVQQALAAAQVPAPPDALARFLAYYDERLLNYTRLYDNVIDVVRGARAHGRVAVLTNKPLAPTERILAGLGVRGLFDDVVGGDGPHPRKPDPASLLALVRAAGATAATSIMVGDSPVDYATAVNAGTHCCLVSYGFGFGKFSPDELKGDECIAADAAELGQAIDRFFNVASGARST